MGIEIDLVFCMRAENDLLVVWWSTDFVFVRVVEMDFFLYADRKSPGFGVNTELDFVLVWVVKI